MRETLEKLINEYGYADTQATLLLLKPKPVLNTSSVMEELLNFIECAQNSIPYMPIDDSTAKAILANSSAGYKVVYKAFTCDSKRELLRLIGYKDRGFFSIKEQIFQATQKPTKGEINAFRVNPPKDLLEATIKWNRLHDRYLNYNQAEKLELNIPINVFSVKDKIAPFTTESVRIALETTSGRANLCARLKLMIADPEWTPRNKLEASLTAALSISSQYTTSLATTKAAEFVGTTKEKLEEHINLALAEFSFSPAVRVLKFEVPNAIVSMEGEGLTSMGKYVAYLTKITKYTTNIDDLLTTPQQLSKKPL